MSWLWDQMGVLASGLEREVLAPRLEVGVLALGPEEGCCSGTAVGGGASSRTVIGALAPGLERTCWLLGPEEGVLLQDWMGGAGSRTGGWGVLALGLEEGAAGSGARGRNAAPGLVGGGAGSRTREGLLAWGRRSRPNRRVTLHRGTESGSWTLFNLAGGAAPTSINPVRTSRDKKNRNLY